MKYHISFDLDLRRNPYKGLYIAFEGIDGSGKTTQVKRLSRYFKKSGQEVIMTREPRDDGLIGRIIRQVLQSKIKIPSVALQYLFSADRSIHHETIIKPALSQGQTIVSDRCFWSGVPYGIMDRTKDVYDHKTGNQVLIAQSILSMYHQFIVPDFAFYLKIPIKVAMARLVKDSKGKEIYEKKEKLEKIMSGYEWLVEKFPKEFTVIDGTKPVKEITETIIDAINSKFLTLNF